MQMMTLEELHRHYKQVRDRLDNSPVKKITPPPAPVIYFEPKPVEPPPAPKPVLQPNVIDTPAQAILREVSEKHRLPAAQVKSDARHKHLVDARCEVAYRLRTELGFSLKQVGRMLGNRDHTTILNAIKRYEKTLAKDAKSSAREVSSDG